MPGEEIKRFFVRLVAVDTPEDLEPPRVRLTCLLLPVLDEWGQGGFNGGIAVVGEDDGPASLCQVAGVHAGHRGEYLLLRPPVSLPQVLKVLGVNSFTLPQRRNLCRSQRQEVFTGRAINPVEGEGLRAHGLPPPDGCLRQSPTFSRLANRRRRITNTSKRLPHRC